MCGKQTCDIVFERTCIHVPTNPEWLHWCMLPCTACVCICSTLPCQVRSLRRRQCALCIVHCAVLHACMQVRPDHHRWRPFLWLSGGQQALVSMALCFALQVSTVAPCTLGSVHGRPKYTAADAVLHKSHGMCAEDAFMCIVKGFSHNGLRLAAGLRVCLSMHAFCRQGHGKHGCVCVVWLSACSPACPVVPAYPLQAVLPSPFYFFDEIDCALDTAAAARVAQYIRARQAKSMQASVHTHAASQPPHYAATHGSPVRARDRHAAAAAGLPWPEFSTGHRPDQAAEVAHRPAQYIVVSHKPQVCMVKHAYLSPSRAQQSIGLEATRTPACACAWKAHALSFACRLQLLTTGF